VIAALTIAAFSAWAASGGMDAVLQGLLGKDQATVERRLGLPDETENNGLQTFLRYRNADSYWLGRADQNHAPLGFQGRANFDCLTTLAFTDGRLRAYVRSGVGCR